MRLGAINTGIMGVQYSDSNTKYYPYLTKTWMPLCSRIQKLYHKYIFPQANKRQSLFHTFTRDIIVTYSVLLNIKYSGLSVEYYSQPPKILLEINLLMFGELSRDWTLSGEGPGNWGNFMKKTIIINGTLYLVYKIKCNWYIQ